MSAQPIIVSIVVPAYNASRWIGETLASVQQQSVRETEIIVVDDGSTDDTAEVAVAAASEDRRIRVIRLANGGVGAARNAGMEAAKGAFIAPLDADDLWHPLKLEKQLKRFTQLGERAGMVYCWYRLVDASGMAIGYGYPFEAEGDARQAIIFRNFVGNASVPLFRRSAVEDVGSYLTREAQGGCQGCEDWDYCIRMAERWQVGAVGEYLVDYRITTAAMSSAAVGMNRSYRLVMKRARERNQDLPEKLFRWSQGHFQRYLASKSYASCDYPSCLRSTGRALRADLAVALDKRLYELVAKSAVWLACGGRKTPRAVRNGRAPASQPSGAAGDLPVDRTWLGKVQTRRWKRILTS